MYVVITEHYIIPELTPTFLKHHLPLHYLTISLSVACMKIQEMGICFRWYTVSKVLKSYLSCLFVVMVRKFHSKHNPVSVEFTSSPGARASSTKRRKTCEEVQRLLSPSPTECITGAQASKQKVKAGNDIEELIVRNLYDLNQFKEWVDENELFGRSIAATLC